MRKFQRVTAVLLASAMVLSLAACKGESEPKKETTENVASAGEATANDTTEEENVVDPAEEEVDEEVVQLEDGMKIIDINFDDNDVDGFVKYNNGGECELLAEDGKFVVDITKCGNVDYGNQAYYDGFALSHGCVYTLSFDISSDIERQVEYRIQINGGDYHPYVGEYIKVGPDMQTISVDFEMTEDSDPAPRLCFNMGKMDDMSGDPGEHKVYIDNIQLVVKDATNAEIVEALPRKPKVNVSQVGYKPADKKTVIISSDKETKFEVKDASTNEVVYSGEFGEYFYDKGSGNNVRQGDFSEVATPGTYYIETSLGKTYNFEIADDIYDDIYKDVVLMLYNQRCGVELDEAISGEYAHPACHTSEAIIYGTKKKKDVSGGWHDAGDYGRYVVSGAKTVQDLFLAYEDNNQTQDDFGIPESGNGIPDLLDEAKFELDWMLKMQDEKSGGVYHKVTCLVFPETVLPQDETADLYLAPISTTATADFAAVMAKASVVYKDIDADFAATCLAAAEKAWNYVKDSDDYEGYKNPEDIVTGEYPDKNTQDEMFFAATELYLATGNDDYKEQVNNRLSAKIKDGLGWTDVGTYAMYDLVKANKTEVSIFADCKDRIVEAADYIVTKGSEDGYFMSLITNYPWGSNMYIANNGITLLMAAKITGDKSYEDFAKKQLDYILGANSVGYCYVTGYGTVSPENTHHRPSQVVGKSMPGMLVGGPDSNLEDSYAKAVLYEQSPAQCYVDNAQSYSCNEITVYWNSPLIYLISAFK